MADAQLSTSHSPAQNQPWDWLALGSSAFVLLSFLVWPWIYTPAGQANSAFQVLPQAPWLGLLPLLAVGIALGWFSKFWSISYLLVGFAGLSVNLSAQIHLVDQGFKLAGDSGLGGYWGLTWAFTLLTASGLGAVGAALPKRLGFLAAALAMALALLLAESLIRGYQIPVGLIPTPSRVAQTLTETWQALLQDARQTFLNEVLLGFVGGVLAGLLVALLLVRFKFLAQGLLPYLTAASSIPIVGIAPVLVASLGSDWPSKAAISAIVCFFPIAINMFRGLTAVDRQQLDLMHSYGASMSQTFTYLRLPGAQPYLFTGLKVAAPLALISAIVGEFFGSPARGLGFRIKLEAGRFSFDVVWAAIVYASVLGLLFYGFIALLERLITHWHSSIREA